LKTFKLDFLNQNSMKINREVKTGIIAILIIGSTIWGYNFLKGKNILHPTDEYYVAYDRIDGIIESGAVYYRGYQVGSIQEIQFNTDNQQSFVLRIVLKKNFKIPVGTEVIAKETNLIAGAKDLQLIFSDSEEYHVPGDTLLPAYDPGLLGVLQPLQDKLNDVVVNLNTTLESLNNTLNPQMQEDLKATMRSFRYLAGEIQHTFSSQGTMGQSFENIETITETFATKSDSLGKAMDNLTSITTQIEKADLEGTLASLDSTLASTNDIMSKINDAEGTAGLIVNDSALYMNLAAATASLDSLLVDLKENPGRYVQVSVFGGKDK
jgi:phospholipid/cholesterol/gamma-HCH transport system substrate-binding protein